MRREYTLVRNPRGWIIETQDPKAQEFMRQLGIDGECDAKTMLQCVAEIANLRIDFRRRRRVILTEEQKRQRLLRLQKTP